MHWYYTDQGQQKGPVEDAALDELAAAGLIRDDTLVWHQGLEGWKSHASVRGPRMPPPMPSVGAGQAQYCAECGRPFPGNELVAIGPAFLCATCKPIHLQRLREGGRDVAAGPMRYAGFWIRFVARVIDSLLLGVVSLVVQIPLTLIMAMPRAGVDPRANLPAMLAFAGIATLANLGIAVSYEAYFLSTRGATLGKMVFGLKVVRPDGSRITAARAVGRYFAYFVSGAILLIGYIMAGFDEEKRALHDRICDTRVIYSR